MNIKHPTDKHNDGRECNKNSNAVNKISRIRVLRVIAHRQRLESFSVLEYAYKVKKKHSQKSDNQRKQAAHFFPIFGKANSYEISQLSAQMACKKP
jgi:hypothetical protein